MMIMEGVFFLFVILVAIGSLVSEYVKGVHFLE
jgi:hypothetical protein